MSESQDNSGLSNSLSSKVSLPHLNSAGEKSHKKAKRGGFCRWKTALPQPRLLFSLALLNNFEFLRSLSHLAVVRVVKCFLFHNLKYLNNGSVEALNLGTTLGSKCTFIFILVSFQLWSLRAKLSKKKSEFHSQRIQICFQSFLFVLAVSLMMLSPSRS